MANRGHPFLTKKNKLFQQKGTITNCHYIFACIEPLSLQNAMAQMLCGDEVGAVVVDIGAATSKFGSAGQDVPQHVFRSDIGVTDEAEKRSYKIGDSAFRVILNDTEIVSPYAGGGEVVNEHDIFSLSQSYLSKQKCLFRG